MSSVYSSLQYGIFPDADYGWHVSVVANRYGAFQAAEIRSLCLGRVKPAGRVVSGDTCLDDATCAECIRVHAEYERPHPGAWRVVVAEPVEIADHSRYETACNYNTVVLTAGSYPVSWTTARHESVPEGKRPYYGGVRVDATLTARHLTNRFFGASSDASELGLSEPYSYTLRLYEYEFKGREEFTRGVFRFVPVGE